MTIWRLTAVDHPQFAEAGLRGTWSSAPACARCGRPVEGNDPQKRIQPLVVTWEPGSEVIADFTDAGFGGDWLVRAAVMDELVSRFSGFECGPVEFVDDPGDEPVPGQSRVPLPYAGPPLCDLWVTQIVEFDRERSSVEEDYTCVECGRPLLRIVGAESVDLDDEANPVHRARRAGCGLYVSETQLEGASVFRVREFSGGSVYCTDAVKVFIEAQEYSNIAFWETGDTFVP